jgi:stress-induced-phosphoprotein 1
MDWHNALRHFEICLQKDPKYEKAYIKRGTVHIALREYDKAMEMFEAAL